MGPSPVDDHSDMPKYHQFDGWIQDNAPIAILHTILRHISFWVCDDWEEVYSNSADGKVLSGSIDSLAEAFALGREVKVGICGLCGDMREDTASALHHEVFVQCGSCYYYTERKQFMAASQPWCG